MANVSKTLLVSALVAALGTGFYEYRTIARQQARLDELEAASVKAEHRERGLRDERVQLLQKLAATARAAETPGTSAATIAAPEAGPAASPAARAAALVRSWMERLPEKTSPEMGLLSESDMLAAINNSPLETEEQATRALISLRAAAQGKLAALLIPVLHRYLATHGDVLPDEPGQLAPYFSPPLDPAILPRYEMLRKGSVGESRESPLVGQRLDALVEGAYDVQFLYSLSQVKVNTLTREPLAYQHALVRFAAANGGQRPASPELLQPYLSSPIEPTRLRELFAGRGATGPTNTTTIGASAP